MDASEQLVEARQGAWNYSASDNLKRALVEEEGVRNTVYLDAAGNPTVGVGHMITDSDGLEVGETVSDDRILDFLEQDLAHAEKTVMKMVGDLRLFQHEFDALVDLVFNVGEGTVSEARSPALNAAIDARDHRGIANELDYHHAGGSEAKGLEIRSDRRTAIFISADYDRPSIT